MNDTQTQPVSARDRVSNAAYALFVQSGFAAVSMQQIADEAGITKATLYHHFRDKRDLYIDAMRLAMASNEVALTNQLAHCTDLRSVVRQLVAHLFSHGSGDLQRLAADFRIHFDAEVQRQFWMQFHPPWQLIRDPVEVAMAQRVVPQGDAMFVARYIYGAISGLSHLNRFEQNNQAINDVLVDRITDTILHGIMHD